MAFTDTQNSELNKPLLAKHIKTRDGGRVKLSYLEGWHVIAEANRIFGFDAWTRETLDLTCVSERERPIGRDQRPGWGVTYRARVRITVANVIRDGCGTGHGIDVDLGQAHESALKEAETDAMKRALMTFGNPFGLALYDKDQANVDRSNGNGNGHAKSNGNGNGNGYTPPDDLWALLDLLSETGQQTLIMCYDQAGIYHAKSFVDLMEYFGKAPESVKKRITPETIKLLNEGRHPSTKQTLISPPGATTAASDPQEPFS